MKYTLLCNQSMKDLKIVDEKGHLNLNKFQEHIQDCDICLDLMETFAAFMDIKKEGLSPDAKKTKAVPSARH